MICSYIILLGPTRSKVNMINQLKEAVEMLQDPNR